MGRFFLALILLFTILLSVAGPFRVMSPSMEDTLLTGDSFLALRFWYDLRVPLLGTKLMTFHEPLPGDLLICVNPIDSGEILVKRCVAVGGQTVSIEEKRLYVDGVEVSLPPGAKNGDPELLDRGPTGAGKRDYLDEITVPDSSIFVLGDNRDFSIDSRFFGPVPRENIRGRVGPVFWSADPDSSWSRPGNKIRLERMFMTVK